MVSLGGYHWQLLLSDNGQNKSDQLFTVDRRSPLAKTAFHKDEFFSLKLDDAMYSILIERHLFEV